MEQGHKLIPVDLGVWVGEIWECDFAWPYLHPKQYIPSLPIYLTEYRVLYIVCLTRGLNFCECGATVYTKVFLVLFWSGYSIKKVSPCNLKFCREFFPRYSPDIVQ